MKGKFFVKVLVLRTILRLSVWGQRFTYDNIDEGEIVGGVKRRLTQSELPCSPQAYTFSHSVCRENAEWMPQKQIRDGDAAKPPNYLMSIQQPKEIDYGSCYEHFCAGALIAPNLVLTAAHCLTNYKSKIDKQGNIDKRTAIYVAQAPLCRHETGKKRLGVRKAFIYPNFDQTLLTNDVAILEARGAFQGPYIDYQSAYNLILKKDMELSLFGYGKQSTIDNDYSRVQLQYLNLTYKEPEACKVLIREELKDVYKPDTMFCTFLTTGSTCEGDSGGPLILNQTNNQNDIIVGIDSWANWDECGRQGPTIFTKVGASSIIFWIDELLQKYGRTHGPVQWVKPHALQQLQDKEVEIPPSPEPIPPSPSPIVPSTGPIPSSPQPIAPSSRFCNGTQDLQCDIEALQSFKIKVTKGANLLSTWSGENPCTWHYVTCQKVDGVNQRVIGVDINFENDKDKYTLAGVMVPEFSKLRYISEFRILSQNIAGTMPPEYSTWKLIQNINLDSNKLTGELSREYSEWTDLVTFSLNYNQFSGTIPPQFSAWKNTETISMAKNSISGSLPVEFSQMTNMKIFRVDGNRQLYGYLPKEYSTMSQISSWNSSDTRINQRVPVEWSTFSSKAEINA